MQTGPKPKTPAPPARKRSSHHPRPFITLKHTEGRGGGGADRSTMVHYTTSTKIPIRYNLPRNITQSVNQPFNQHHWYMTSSFNLDIMFPIVDLRALSFCSLRAPWFARLEFSFLLLYHSIQYTTVLSYSTVMLAWEWADALRNNLSRAELANSFFAIFLPFLSLSLPRKIAQFCYCLLDCRALVL